MHHTLCICVVRNTHPVKRRVYSWGWGECGRLGVGHEECAVSPTEVALLSHRNVVGVAAGEQHSVCCTATGEVYAWGSNRFGQLGGGADGNLRPNSVLPMKVEVLGVARSVAAGSRHSAAVVDGRVKLWGWGEEGQLGNECEMNENKPREVELGKDALTPSGNVGRVVRVGLGVSHTVVLLENPTVVGVASGLGSPQPVVAVAATKTAFKHEPHAEEKKVEHDDSFKKIMEQQAAATMAKEKEAAARLMAQQKMIEERREREKETLRRFEGRKSEAIAKREEEDVQRKMERVVERTRVLVERTRTPSPIDVAAAVTVVEPADDDSGSSAGSGVPVPNALINRIIAHEAASVRPMSPNTVSFKNKVNYDQVFYHPDQPVEKCFVANSARRAMMRQITRKEAQGGGAGRGAKGRGGGKKKKAGAAGAIVQRLGAGEERPQSSSILRRSSFSK